MKNKEVDFIINEINSSWTYINDRRKSALDIFRTYLLLLIVLGSYISFVSNVTVNNIIKDVFILWGMIIIIVVFLTGLGLLYTLGKNVGGTLIQYKSIGRLRELLASSFKKEEPIEEFMINPIESSRIQIENMWFVPVLSTLFNMGVLGLSVYFLKYMDPQNPWYYFFVILLIIIILIFCQAWTIKKHISIIENAKSISEKVDSFEAKKIVAKKVDEAKKRISFKLIKWTNLLVHIGFVTFIILNSTIPWKIEKNYLIGSVGIFLILTLYLINIIILNNQLSEKKTTIIKWIKKAWKDF